MRQTLLCVAILGLMLLTLSPNQPLRVLSAQTLQNQHLMVDHSLAQYFKERQLKGSFLLYDLKQNHYTAYNLARVKEAFLPASTYKIFNSLVALETGAIKDEEEVIKWDSKHRDIEEWNRDQNMATAMKYSVVWFYQELARRIGQERMQHYVDLAGYGNGDLSGGIDQFWLTGKLRITSSQQIDLLVNLYHNKLPFSQRSLAIVKRIMILAQTPTYTLRGKTGWTGKTKPSIGWFVGYVETADNAYFFATNLEIQRSADVSARIDITKEILRKFKIIN